MERENQLVATISPIAGAVAGALGVTVGAPKLGVPREQAALGAAVLGFATAANTNGWVRGVALGVGAAGTAIAIAQRVGSEAKSETQRLATRHELQAALRRFVESRAEQPSAYDSFASEAEAPTLAPMPAPEVIQRFSTVVEQLTEDERKLLSTFIDTAPDDTLRTTQAFLLETPTDESVRFLREHLLTSQMS